MDIFGKTYLVTVIHKLSVNKQFQNSFIQNRQS